MRRLRFGAAALAGWLLGGSAAQAEVLAALCMEDKMVRLIDGREGKVLSTDSAGPNPIAMYFSKSQFRLHVLQGPSAEDPTASLRQIGVATGMFEGSALLAGCRGPAGVGPAPEGRMYVACEESDYLLEVSGWDGSLHRSHRVGRGISGALWHAESEQIVLTSRSSGEVMLYDPEAAQRGEKREGLAGLVDVAAGREETALALLSAAKDGGGVVRLYDPGSGSLSQPVTVGAAPRSTLFVGDSHVLLVTTGESGGGLAAVDTEAETVERRLDVGAGASGLALDAAGQMAWVSLEPAGVLLLIDLERWVVDKSFALPGRPRQLLVVRD